MASLVFVLFLSFISGNRQLFVHFIAVNFRLDLFIYLFILWFVTFHLCFLATNGTSLTVTLQWELRIFTATPHFMLLHWDAIWHSLFSFLSKSPGAISLLCWVQKEGLSFVSWQEAFLPLSQLPDFVCEYIFRISSSSRSYRFRRVAMCGITN